MSCGKTPRNRTDGPGSAIAEDAIRTETSCNQLQPAATNMTGKV
jgi:hypothetical protein